MARTRAATLTLSLAACLSTLHASSGFAESITCQARVALNRIYDVTLDTASGDVALRNDAGTSINGRANVTISGRTGNTILFLATSFSQGVELEIEAGGSGRVAMCLAANECYICR